jgi:hypothetical protein
MKQPFRRTPEMLCIHLPRRIKDDQRGRKRGRVRRRLLIRFYRRLADRYRQWEEQWMSSSRSPRSGS